MYIIISMVKTYICMVYDYFTCIVLDKVYIVYTPN